MTTKLEKILISGPYHEWMDRLGAPHERVCADPLECLEHCPRADASGISLLFFSSFFGVIIKEIDLHFTMEFTADGFLVQEGGEHELLMTPPFSHSVESAV